MEIDRRDFKETSILRRKYNLKDWQMYLLRENRIVRFKNIGFGKKTARYVMSESDLRAWIDSTFSEPASPPTGQAPGE